MRDLIALSTLPAVWLGANPVRLGESLLAAVAATICPSLAYFRMHLEPHSEPLEIVQVDDKTLSQSQRAALSPQLLRWGLSHDPDQLMPVSIDTTSAQKYVSVHLLGFDGEHGLLAVGFDSPLDATPYRLLLLNTAANQALVATKNAQLIQRQKQLFDQAQAEIAVRTRTEEKLRFLVEIEHAVQRLTMPEEVMAVVARMLGDYLNVDRCAYAEVEDESVFVVTGDYPRHLPSIGGRWPITLFGSECARLLAEKKTFVVMDTESDPRIEAEVRSAYRATDIRSLICVPLHKDGIFTAAMAVHQQTVRTWTADEIELVEMVVGRCWESLERTKSMRDLRTLAAVLEERVSERTFELRSVVDELRGFTYSIAHDLRQHIRGIDINAAMIVEDVGDTLAPESLEILKRLRSSAKELGKVVDALLQYARLGRQKLQKTSVDLSQMASDLCRVYSSTGIWPNPPKVTIQDGLCVEGDPTMLKLMLQNLIDNAAKYSEPVAFPEIEIGRCGEGKFYVRDNGIGFAPAYAEVLFRPFERLHRREEFAGTGIGLANVKRIVEKHGGRVWAESEGVGRGATFYFTLESDEEEENESERKLSFDV